MKIIKDVTGKLISAYVEAPFDKGKEFLGAKGYRIISAQEMAKLRMQEGINSAVSELGNWIREGIIYVPKKGKILTKNSPIMESSIEATDCHRNNEELYLTAEEVEKSLADSVNLSDEAIPTERFADNEITAFLFGKDAKAYGEFLREAGIKEMPVWLSSLKDEPYARQLWLRSFNHESNLIGYSRDLNRDNRVRGVSDSGEASTQKIQAYTSEQIKQALQTLKLSKLESSIFSELNRKN
ncbi:MAG: hypothetical protein Q8L29_01565 [archaeon]|nr:hypothetical protein [archaeon]